MQDWPKLLKKVEKKYLYPLLIHLLRRQSKNVVADKVDASVTAQQEDWPNIRTRCQHVLDWEEVCRKLKDQLFRSH